MEQREGNSEWLAEKYQEGKSYEQGAKTGASGLKDYLLAISRQSRFLYCNQDVKSFIEARKV